MRRDVVDARAPHAPLPEPQCEVLFEIVDGKLGSIQLGRLLKGNDAGRLVVLRTLPGKASPELASATDLARSIAHPKLAKVLGIVRDAETWYVASEYISGVTLLELADNVAARGTSLEPKVAVRILLDALRAAAEAQRLLAETAHLHDVRCIYAESIWIADFGEVFLSELLIAPLLAENIPDDEAWGSAAEQDVQTAIAELKRLVDPVGASATGASERRAFPPALERIFATAQASADGAAYVSLEQLIDDLAALGDDLIATESEVSAELQRVVGLVLERRYQKLDMIERVSPEPKEEDATRFFRVAMAPEQSTTTRPPPGQPSESPNVERLSTARPERRRSRPSDATDEPTALYQSKAPTLHPPPTPLLPVQPSQPSAQPARLPAVDLEVQPNPISAVWRQARALLDSPARGAAQRLLQAPAQVQAPALASPPPRDVPKRRTDSNRPDRVIIVSKAIFALALLLALAALIHSLWLRSAHPKSRSPETASMKSKT